MKKFWEWLVSLFTPKKQQLPDVPPPTPPPVPPPAAASGRNLIPALTIIKEFEGCRLNAYPDPGTGGVPWTIGWGHTQGVYPGMVITQQQADDLLSGEVREFAMGVESLLKVPVTNNEFCALVSFAYNVGLDIDDDFIAEGLGDSTLLRLLNSGRPRAEVANEFPKWNRGGSGVMPGLVRRRAAERALFLTA